MPKATVGNPVIPGDVQEQIDSAAESESALGGIGMIAGEDEGKPLLVNEGNPPPEVLGTVGTQEREDVTLTPEGQIRKESEEAVDEESEESKELEDEPDEGEELEEGESEEPEDELEDESSADQKSKGKKKTPIQKLQGVAESRLNEINKIRESPNYIAGQAMAQNPELAQIFQAVAKGQISVQQLLGGMQQVSTKQQQAQLEPPTMPNKPSDFNDQDSITPGTASHQFKLAKDDFYEKGMAYLIEQNQRTQATSEQQELNRQSQVKREGTIQELIGLHGYERAAAEVFYEKYSKPGSLSIDLLVRADKAATVDVTATRRKAKTAALRAKSKRPRVPTGRVVGGTGGTGDQTVEKLSEEEAFNKDLMSSHGVLGG